MFLILPSASSANAGWVSDRTAPSAGPSHPVFISYPREFAPHLLWRFRESFMTVRVASRGQSPKIKARAVRLTAPALFLSRRSPGRVPGGRCSEAEAFPAAGGSALLARP